MTTAFQIIKIIPCAKRLSLEAQGLYGFHDSVSCPDCQKLPQGFRVHAGNSILSPFVGHNILRDTVVSENPVYVL